MKDGDVRAIHEAVVERANELDRMWFLEHPTRRYRVREPLGYEFNERFPKLEPDQKWLVIVVELKAGLRMRTPFVAPAWVDTATATDEDLEIIFRNVAPDIADKVIGIVRKHEGPLRI